MEKTVLNLATGQLETLPLSAEEVAEIESRRAEIAARSYAVKRREEYNRRGVTMEAIMEGVIEYLGERPQKLQTLMAIRDEVRAQIPKDAP